MSTSAHVCQPSNRATLPAIFESVVREHSDRIALLYQGESLTYLELNQRANQLARSLHLIQVRPGEAVGLYLDRSFDLYVTMLAVLKAGGCVVPLNPAYPAGMINHIVDTAGIRLVVHHGQASVADLGLNLHVQTMTAAELIADSASLDTGNVECGVDADTVAFLMFTSGSTGHPKGVRIAHRGLARLAVDSSELEVSKHDRFLQLAAFSFAASTNEIWLSLLHGATLIVAPPGLPSLPVLRDIIIQHQISVVSLPCGLFNLLVDNELGCLAGLRVLFVSGDFASAAHLVRAAEATPARIYNGYGCTENSSISALYRIQAGTDVRGQSPVPVGKPLPLVTMEVLDSSLRPCPAGDVGELCIGGTGLAKGYLDLDSLTEERFVRIPALNGAVLYRTGDLARKTSEGDIVLVGRSDSLVKIRGYRVETSAVELALRSCGDAAQVVVKAFSNEANEKTLVAFFTTWSGRPIDGGELRRHLQELVPEYMIPSTFCHLEAMPMTMSGKIDRASLRNPAPERARAEGGVGVENPVESVILQMWQGIVGVDSISPIDSFLGHGGNSLQFVQLAASLQKIFGVDVAPEDVFRYGTCQKLAGYIEKSRNGAAHSVPSGRSQD